MDSRTENFERMLTAVQTHYRDTAARMESLKADGKEKTATYRQLLADKLLYRQFLALYETYGLLD